MQARMEHYPGQDGKCMECGGHCMEPSPCQDGPSCMANEGFMHCHAECMPKNESNNVRFAAGAVCSTTDGKPCVFPFVYKGTAVTSCRTLDAADTPWCPTSADASGAHVSSSGDTVIPPIVMKPQRQAQLPLSKSSWQGFAEVLWCRSGRRESMDCGYSCAQNHPCMAYQLAL